MASTDPPPVREMVVPPLAAPADPAPRSTTPLVKVTTELVVYVPAASSTTWPSGHWAIAALRSSPGAGREHTWVRTGSPSEPSAFFDAASVRIPGFHVVVSAGSSSPAGTTRPPAPDVPADPPFPDPPFPDPPFPDPPAFEPPEPG